MWGVITVALSLVPALCAWAWGRRLVALADDAALPERLAAYRSRLGQVTVVSLLGAGLASPGYAPWPLLGAGLLLVAHFPLRKALYAESWGLGGYLAHVVRSSVGLLGFWVLLAFTPTLVHAAGAYGTPVALVLAGLLLAWEIWYPTVFLRLMRAGPLDRPDLAARFAAILARASIRPPRLYRGGPTTGRWINAFALPGVGVSRVLFSNTLLASLEPDELAAIFAHEVAHLEHYHRRRVFWLSAVSWLAIVVAVLAVPLAGEWAAVVSWAWLLVVGFGLTARLARHKAHEIESDRRAVALCGDAGAVARGLVKLHVLSRLPRRWEVDFERGASHPSLAHRIQAIQPHAGPAASAAGLPVVVAGHASGVAVVFDREALHRLEGVPPDADVADADRVRAAARTARSAPYRELTELRVRATLRGTSALVGTDRTGGSWSVALRADTVGRVQAALDAVDVQLARPRLGFVHGRLPATVLGALLVYASLMTAMWVTGVAALIALLRPAAGPLAALGVTAIGGAVLALLGPVGSLPIEATPYPLGAAVVGGGLGGLVLALAWVRGRAIPGGHVSAAVAALGLGLVALYGWATLIWGGVEDGVFGLHRAASLTTSATLAPLGVAAALATRPDRRARAAAAAAAGLAIVPLVLASGWFVGRFAPDPLLAPAPPVTWRPGPLRPAHEARFPEPAVTLRLSPSGLEYAAHVAPSPKGGSRAWQLRLGRFGGAHQALEADEVEFLAGGRLLATEGDELRVVTTVAPRTVVWRRALPEMSWRALVVDPTRAAWRVTGPDADERRLLTLSGVAGRDAVETRDWALPAALRDADFVAVGDAALAVQADRWRRDDARSGSRWLTLTWALLVPPAEYHEVWQLDARGARRLVRTRLHVRCDGPRGSRAAFLCLAYERSQTRVWEIRPRTGALVPLGALAGPFPWHALGPDGRLAVWAGNEVTLLDAAGGPGVRLRLPDPPAEVTLQPGWLGTLSRGEGGTVIRVYDVRQTVPAPRPAPPRLTTGAARP